MSVYDIQNNNFWKMYWATVLHPTTASRTALDVFEDEASNSTLLSPKKTTFDAFLDMMEEATK